MPTRLLLYVFFLSLHLGLAAQPQFHFAHLGKAEGLADNGVQALAQDEKGYIWVAGQHVIQRYDGHRFLNFYHRSADPNSIPEGPIRGMMADQAGKLWIHSGSHHLGYLNLSTYKYTPVPIDYPDSLLQRIDAGFTMDHSGIPVLVLVKRDILTYSPKTNSFSKKNNSFEFPEGFNPLHIVYDDQNNFWAGGDAGILKYNVKTKVLSYSGHNTEHDPLIKAFESYKVVNCLYLKDGKRGWISSWPRTGLKLLSYEYATGAVKFWQDDIGRAINGMYYQLYDIIPQEDGSLWFSGSNLFERLDPVTNKLKSYNNQAGGDAVHFDYTHVLEDREKSIWVGTDRGLYRFNPSAHIFTKHYNLYPGSDSAYTPDVNSFLELQDGNILVSTWGNGIFAYDKHFSPVSVPYLKRGSGEGMVWCMLQRPNGDIWRGNQEGVMYIYHAQSHRTEIQCDPLFHNSTIRQVAEDQTGHIWVGTQHGHLLRWDDVLGRYDSITRFSSTIQRLYIDKSGSVWIATTHDGTFRMNADTKKIIAHYEYPRLPMLAVNDVMQYNDSMMLLAGTHTGILNLHTDRFDMIRNNLTQGPNEVMALQVDKKGTIWMAGRAGIMAYNPSDQVMHSFNEEDGVENTSFNPGSGARFKDGSIAFGTSHEFYHFDPGHILRQSYRIPEMTITGIQVMDKSLNVDSVFAQGVLELSSRENSIRIDFSSLWYQNSYGIYYMLEGIDKKPILSDVNATVSYNYLPSGTFVFKVGIEDSDGRIKWKSLHIHVQAPFWKTWWFFSLIALLILAILYFLDRQRILRLTHEQSLRSTIAANLQEDVNVTLQKINVLSEIAGMKAETDPSQSRDFIEQIKARSRDMVLTMSDVLWSIDPKNDNLSKLEDRLREIAQVLSLQTGAAMSVDFSAAVRKLSPDMQIRHGMLNCCKQAMIFFAETVKAPMIRLSVDCAGNQVVVRIIADKKIQAQHRKLREIRDRVESLAGRYELRTGENDTVLTLECRYKNRI